MLDLTEIHSLSAFQRNTRAHLRRLKKSGRPQILTVNGKAQVVVQDARSYQKLLERVDALEGVRRGLASVERGEGDAVDVVFESIRRRRRLARGR